MNPLPFINRNKRIYKNLHPCFCPTLQETVYFTSEGLHHLLYNRRRPRSCKEQYYRAGLIPYLTRVIIGAVRVEKIIQSKVPFITIWLLLHEVEVSGKRQIIKVILKQKGAGRVIFLSAMRKKYVN